MMNVREENTVNICKEGSVKDVLKKCHSDNILSPRRSTRIKKTITPNESCDKKELQQNEPIYKELPNKKSVKPSDLVLNDQVNQNGNCHIAIPNRNKDVDIKSSLSQMSSEEDDDSFAAIFDGIFERRHSKTESKVPTALNKDSIKERNFCKRNALDAPLNYSDYIYDTNNLPTEDVSKVFRIISKPTLLSNMTADTKSPLTKSPLKTYSNKRKSFNKPEVIESFGLPDCPIAPKSVQSLVDDELDVAVQDAKEITLLDVECMSDPWIIADIEDKLEEVRTKLEPTKHDFFKTNGSILDFSDNFESLMEPKQINIEAIKINFHKILSIQKSAESELQQQAISKKSNHHLSKYKDSTISKSNVSSVNSDILLVEDNSLTVRNKEFEFSNDSLVPNSSTPNVIKKHKNLQRNHIDNSNDCKITKRKLRSSLKNEKMGDTEESSSMKKCSPEETPPKNVSDSYNIISDSQCSSQFFNAEEKTVEPNNIEIINGSKKKLLNSTDSSTNRRTHRRSLGITKYDKQRTRKYKSTDKILLNNSACTKKGTNTKNSKNFHKNKPVADAKVVMEEKLLTKIPDTNRRILRSKSQDSFEFFDKPVIAYNTTKQRKVKPQTISQTGTPVQKPLTKTNLKGSISDSSLDSTNPETFQNMDNSKKLVPEITIVLNPLDIFKLNENTENQDCDVSLPTTRVLRSSKITPYQNETVQSQDIPKHNSNRKSVSMNKALKSITHKDIKTEKQNLNKTSYNNSLTEKEKSPTSTSLNPNSTVDRILDKPLQQVVEQEHGRISENPKEESKEQQKDERPAEQQKDKFPVEQQKDGKVSENSKEESKEQQKDKLPAEQQKDVGMPEKPIRESGGQDKDKLTVQPQKDELTVEPQEDCSSIMDNTNIISNSDCEQRTLIKNLNIPEEICPTEIISSNICSADQVTELCESDNVLKHTIHEKKIDIEQVVELKLDTEDPKKLEITNSCKTLKPQKFCEQSKEENLKMDLISNNNENLSVLDNEEKNDTIKTTEEEVLKMEEKALSCEKMIDSNKLLHNQSDHNFEIYKKNPVQEYLESNVTSNSKSILDITSDKTEEESNTIVPERTYIVVAAEEFCRTKQNTNEFETVLISEKMEDCVFEQVDNKLERNKDQEIASTTTTFSAEKPASCTENNLLDKSRNNIDNRSSTTKVSPRLKEKREKFLRGSKETPAEESLKNNKDIKTQATQQGLANEKYKFEAHSSDTCTTDLIVKRKRGRPRKSVIAKELAELSVNNDTIIGTRRPLARRQSLDDINLLSRYNKYFKEKKTTRSKSMTARGTLENGRKDSQDKLQTSTKRINAQIKTAYLNDEDMDLLSWYKKNTAVKKREMEIQQNFKNVRTLSSRDKPKGNSSVPSSTTANNIGDSKEESKLKSAEELPQINVKKKSSPKVPKEHNFKVGDIIWSRIGAHPFWPCLVTKEPGTGRHKKTFQMKRYQRQLYHVRFFGDKGRRAWIRKNHLMEYSDSDDLEKFKNKMKSENKPVPSACVVKYNVFKKWKCAVDEAEQVKLQSVKEKLLFFKNVLLKQKESDILKNKNTQLKRKFNDEESEDKPELTTHQNEIIQKKNKKGITNENKDNEDSMSVKEEGMEDMNQSQNVENISQNEEILTKVNEKRQIDEGSEISSKTSSDILADMSLNSVEAQKALYKRNNLFKGVSREKVCQYCCKPGEVWKCRGRCNGSYHMSCSEKILQEDIPKKKKERSSNDNSLENDNTFQMLRNKRLNSGSHSDCSGPDIHIIQNKKLTKEEQVQIITVPSSVFNTPPRKTFPPDFKNMSLAEQIDYKMKEIMHKFESKMYAVGSSSDSNIQENLTMKSSQVASVSSNKQEQQTESENLTNLKTREGINEPPKKKLKLLPKKRTFIRHVTADSEYDTEQEDRLNTDDELDEVYNKAVNRKNFKCGFCESDLVPYCFVCHKAVSSKGSVIRQKCSVYPCGRFYHPECLKLWPQTQWSLIQTTRNRDADRDMDSFVCPLHVCHTCVSDDPRAATSRCSGDKIVKCLRCPSTYHSSNLCVPAGTVILSSSQIICPRHREKNKLTINTTWCFICSKGGNLICCETCPTSVHPECLPVSLTDDDKFICEDCESGRLPLYDEIVWVKLGKFRWWPALILFPNEVPYNVRNKKHNIGEFVVKFFGTYDYYWVSRGRSFLFQDGDTGHCNSVKKKVDAAFNRAVEEAVVAHKLKKEFKLNLEVEPISSLKPPPYIRIKVNKPVGNVRHLDLDLSSTNACECDPKKLHPCGPESDCLNRLLLTECNPEMCPAGVRCKNQSFEKREYPPLVPYKTQERGWGLKTLAPIKKGQFVIEYVGELIDGEEYQRRIQKMHEQKEENYYFLTIDKDRMIDAGPKGNAARFMNHCCQPNCETQKWTVNGDTRVGLFAAVDIPADTELTFNYNLECVGKEKKVCRCGAPNCSGYIGVKVKQDSEMKKPKRLTKKKKLIDPVVLPPCFECGKMGFVIPCNNKMCNRAFHQKCLNTTEYAEVNKFICPWHNCNICSKRTIRCCVKCINSYCPSHSDGNIRYDNLLGFVCNTHDPAISADNSRGRKFSSKESDTTDETAVSSTTLDDTDDDEDWMPLLTRLQRMKSKEKPFVDTESDNDSNISRPSTTRTQSIFSNDDSQDEGAISSASQTNEGGIVKRKRGRPRKMRGKKIKLQSKANLTTASSSFTDDSLRDHSSSELTSKHNIVN